MGAGLARDVDLFGADRDPPGLLPEDPHAEFSKLEWRAAATVELWDWRWNGSLDGQHARRGLRAAELLYAGGVGSVRGFEESAAGGDRGWVLRNEWGPRGVWTVEALGMQAAPFIFLDSARLKALAAPQAARLTGGGLGLRLGSGKISGQFLLAEPFSVHEAWAEGARLHFTLALQL